MRPWLNEEPEAVSHSSLGPQVKDLSFLGLSFLTCILTVGLALL